MAEIDPIILELRANLKVAQAEVRKYAADTDRAFQKQERDVQRLEKQMLKSSTAIGGAFRGLAATLGTYFTGRELTGMIDSFTRLQNNLRVAGQEGEELARVQGNLLDISGRYGVSVETLSNVFLKASLAQKELGASTAQIIQLNEIVAASLKITGTSAEEARGALLQLGQALGSDIVRGEEFNSLLENALPVVQAAARGIDRFEGSVSRLRKAVVDGKVSSAEFFQGILKGGVQTLADAERATLTLSGAFEALKSRLTVYVGEAANANGVTAALAGGLQLLADNLETIIPALAVIGTALGVGFVTNAVRARIAALATAGAMTGLSAAARGALAALGGPIGIAITALTVGLSYLAATSRDTSRSLEELEGNLTASESRLDDARKQAQAAGVNIDNLKRSTDSATGSFSSFTNIVWSSVDAMTRAARAAKELTLAKIALSTAEAKAQIPDLALRGRLQAEAIRIGQRTGNPVDEQFIANTNENSAKLNVLAATIRVNEETKAIIGALGDRYKEPGSDGSAAAVEAGKKTKGRKGSSGPDPLDAIFRAQQDELNAQLELARAKSQNALEAGERGQLERDALNLEAQIRDNEITEALRRKDITAEQAKAQREILDQLYGKVELANEETGISVRALGSLYGLAIAREERLRVEQEAADLAQTQFRADQDALRNQYDLAVTDDDRRAIALRILDAEDAYLRSKLEAVIANNDLTEAVRKQAEIELAALNASAEDRKNLVLKANASALDRFIERTGDTRARVEEAVVRELQAVNDGITNALTKQLGIKNQFVKDLFSIFLDEVIFRPLAEAMRNGQGGGGGLFSSLLNIGASLFGRASGGYVAPGQTVRVNEHRGGAEYLRMGSQGGTVIPLGQVNTAAARSGTGDNGIATVRLELSGDIDARIVNVAGPVAVEVFRAGAPRIVEAAANETLRRAGRPTI